MFKPYIAVVALLFGGCNTLRNMTGSHSTPGPSALPDDYTVTGTTSTDYQVVQPIRVTDSAIVVRVLTPGSTAYRTLNPYEYRIDASGTGGIGFRHVAYPSYNSNGALIGLTIMPDPVAPKGTAYTIRSVTTTVSKSLY